MQNMDFAMPTEGLRTTQPLYGTSNPKSKPKTRAAGTKCAWRSEMLNLQERTTTMSSGM